MADTIVVNVLPALEPIVVNVVEQLVVESTGPGGDAAPKDASYLVAIANGDLTNEIPVGTTPGGELGGTWAVPTVDATHSGSSHASVQAAAEATAAGALALEAALARNADNLNSGTVADARIAPTIARDSEVAAEAALARNADNLTSGTVADARVAGTITRDSELTAAVADEVTARNAAIAVAIANLIASAPGLLDTLDEIAAALGDDPNFAATITTALATKVAKSLYDANTIVKADADDTPAPLTVGEQTIVGRKTGGNIAALTAAEVRTLLALVVGTNVQAWDGDLDTLAANISAFGQSLVAAANAGAGRTVLGLGTAATHAHGDYDVAGAAAAVDADLDAHVGDTVDAHDASAIAFAPNGSIAATNVQAAIQEVRDEAGGGSGVVQSIVEGTNITVDATDPANPIVSATGSGTAGTVSQDIAQVAHGFSVGDAARLDGDDYVPAQADSAENAEVVGLVSAVADADNFTLVTHGKVAGLSGLTAGEGYFLDPVTPGALTATAPDTVGQISKPLLIADSTTSGFFFNWRGAAIAALGGNSQTEWMIGVTSPNFATPQVFESSNGRLWQPNGFALADVTAVSIACNGDEWLIATGDEGTGTSLYRRAIDGDDWEPITTPFIVNSVCWTGAAFGWVIAGAGLASGPTNPNPDGSDWDEATTPFFIGAVAAFDGTTVLVAGASFSLGGTAVMSSADLITFDETASPFDSDTTIDNIVTDGETWLIVGTNTSTGESIATAPSVDPVTWTLVSTDLDNKADTAAAVWDGTYFWVGSPDDPIIIRSVDAVTWESVTHPLSGIGPMSWASAGWNGTQLLFVRRSVDGEFQGPTNMMYTLDGGTTWLGCSYVAMNAGGAVDAAPGSICSRLRPAMFPPIA